MKNYNKSNFTTNNYSSTIILILSLSYVYYTFIKSMQTISKSIVIDNRFFVYIPIILFVFTITGIITKIKKPKYLSKLFLLYLIGQTILLIIDLAYGELSKNDYANTFIPAVLPSLIFLFFRSSFKQRNITEVALIRIYSFSLIIFIITYILYWFTIQSNLLSYEQGAINAAYFIMLLLPPCLLLKSKSVKLLLILGVFVIICSSLKRGGIIAFSSSIIGYFLISFMWSKKKNVSVLITIIILLSITPYAFAKLDNMFDNRIISRFQNIQDDSGSGRLEIYMKVINNMEKSSTLNILFGHGGDAVRKKVTHDFTAHNDFIEIAFNYGIIMLFILILIHFALIVKIYHCIRNNSHYAFPLTYSYIIFLILSLISHVIIYPYFILLLPFWALVFSKDSVSKTSIRNENWNSSLSFCV